MDGTLVNSLGIWSNLWTSLGERYFNDKCYRPDPTTEKAIRTLTLYDGMLLLHEKEGLGASAKELYQIADETCLQFYTNEVKVKKGVLEFLNYLRKKGVRMCIASASAPHLISLVIDICGLKPYFHSVISCNEIGKGKEHPDAFFKAQKYLETPKESTWVFEDSITALETATNAGYRTVGIYDKYNYDIDRVAQVSTIYRKASDI